LLSKTNRFSLNDRNKIHRVIKILAFYFVIFCSFYFPQVRADIVSENGIINWVVDSQIINAEEVEIPEDYELWGMDVYDDKVYIIGRDDGYSILYSGVNGSWSTMKTFGKRWDYIMREGSSFHITKNGQIILCLLDGTNDVLYVSNDGISFRVLARGERNEYCFSQAVEDEEGNIYLGLYGIGDRSTHNPYVYKLNPELTSISLLLNFTDNNQNHIKDIEYWNDSLYLILGENSQEVYRYNLIVDELVKCLDSKAGLEYHHISEIFDGFNELTVINDSLIIGGDKGGFSVLKGAHLSSDYTESWAEPVTYLDYPRLNPLSASDSAFIDDLIYFAMVGARPNYPSGVYVYSPEHNEFLQIARIIGSDEIQGGVKQVGQMEASNWVYFYYSIDVGNEKTRGIIKIKKLSTKDISNIFVDDEILDRNIYSLKPVTVDLSDYDLDYAYITFEPYSVVDRILRSENFNDFSFDTWYYDYLKVGTNLVEENSVPLNNKYFNLTLLNYTYFSERQISLFERDRKSIVPILSVGDHVVQFVIFKTEEVLVREQRAISFTETYYDYFDNSDRITLTGRVSPWKKWQYEWIDYTADSTYIESQINIGIDQGSVKIAYFGSYLTNQSVGYFPPVNGTYMPKNIEINNNLFKTDSPILMKNVDKLDIMLPADGCGSIKMKINLVTNIDNLNLIPNIIDQEQIEFYQGSKNKITINGNNLDKTVKASLGEDISINKITEVSDEKIDLEFTIDYDAFIGSRDIILHSENGISSFSRGLVINEHDEASFVVKNIEVNSSGNKEEDTILVTLLNIGRSSGSNNIILFKDGVLINENNIAIGSNESIIYDFKSSILDESLYNIMVEETGRNYKININNNATIQDFVIKPTEIRKNDDIVIDIKTRNVGDKSSTFLFPLVIDGEMVDKKIVNLDVKESKVLTFKIGKLDVGNHSAIINDNVVFFKVNDFESTLEPTIYGLNPALLIVAIIVIFLVLYFVLSLVRG